MYKPGKSGGCSVIDVHFRASVSGREEDAVCGGPALCAASTISCFRSAGERCRFMTLNCRFTECYNHVNVKLH
ncbi:hypothetical protein D3C75_965980 [compost metagenome]